MKDGELWKGVEPPPPLMAADQSPVMLKDGLLNLGRARHCAESTGARRKDVYAPRIVALVIRREMRRTKNVFSDHEGL